MALGQASGGAERHNELQAALLYVVLTEQAQAQTVRARVCVCARAR
jgi:hypothetical protein